MIRPRLVSAEIMKIRTTRAAWIFLGTFTLLSAAVTAPSAKYLRAVCRSRRHRPWQRPACCLRRPEPAGALAHVTSQVRALEGETDLGAEPAPQTLAAPSDLGCRPKAQRTMRSTAAGGEPVLDAGCMRLPELCASALGS
jgi:hypothetical protein